MVTRVENRNRANNIMSAHVLLNLLNELGKRDPMQGLLRILSLFRREFKKFKNAEGILDSINNMTLKSIKNRKVKILQYFTQRYN